MQSAGGRKIMQAKIEKIQLPPFGNLLLQCHAPLLQCQVAALQLSSIVTRCEVICPGTILKQLIDQINKP